MQYICVYICIYTVHYTVEYHSAIKNDYAIWDNMDGPREYYAKWNKSDKDRCHIISIISEKKKQLKKHNKSELIDTENKQLVTRGEVRLENEWNRWGWLTGTKIHLPKKKKKITGMKCTAWRIYSIIL